jgi:hypothetical protein
MMGDLTMIVHCSTFSEVELTVFEAMNASRSLLAYRIARPIRVKRGESQYTRRFASVEVDVRR